MKMGMEIDLGKILRPRNVAIVGASPNKAPGRYDFFDYLKKSEFTGDLYPVNKRYQEVDGRKCYPSIAEIPGEVDLAIFMIPATAVIDMLRDTPAGKLKFGVIVTSGFSEVGKSDLQRELVEVARARDIRLTGPNCMGIYSRAGRLASSFGQTFGPGSGSVGIVAQSGGVASNFVTLFEDSGVTLNCSVSIGNQCDLGLEDFLRWFEVDDDIKTIAAYIEDFNRAREFLELAQKISRKKPIVILKGGVTQQGSRATSSHTGALALPSGIWQGVVKQAGIIPMDSYTELPDFCRALEWGVLPKGPGITTITPGGSLSVQMTDSAVLAGLEVPDFSEPVRKKLSSFIAEVNTIVSNPVDLGSANFQPKYMKPTIETVAEDENIHSILVYLFVYPSVKDKLMDLNRDFIVSISEAQKSIDKPVYIVPYCPYGHTDESDEARRVMTDMLNSYKIPYTQNIEDCIKIIKRLSDYSRYLQSVEGE